MSMTRKDYQTLATALGVAGRGMGDDTWRGTVLTICQHLKADNIRFSAAIFCEWAGDVREMRRDIDGTKVEGFTAYRNERIRLGL